MALAVPVSGAKADHVEAVLAIYSDLSVSAPNSQVVTVCHGFGCKFRTPVAFGNSDRAKLNQLLAPGRASPEAERRAVAEAVAWFGRRIAPETGTGRAVARAGPAHAGDPSQFDCIDSSRNTTSVLLVLQELKLLRHHSVQPPEARGYLINLRLPHATAVLRERQSGRDWAVDSWTRNSGEKPEVMPLEQWFAYKS
jgi:hypothetical protein